MKRFALIISVLTLFSVYSFSQIEIKSDGIVYTTSSLHAGDTLTTDSYLHVEEDATISGELTVTDLLKARSEFQVGNTGSPYPTIKMNVGLNIEAFLGDYPSYHVGSVGTSTHPWQSMYCDNITANGVLLGSDLRLKENVKTVKNSFSILRLVTPVSYDLKEVEIPKDDEVQQYVKDANVRKKNRFGFIAQDLKDVFPESVFYDSLQSLL